MSSFMRISGFFILLSFANDVTSVSFSLSVAFHHHRHRLYKIRISVHVVPSPDYIFVEMLSFGWWRAFVLVDGWDVWKLVSGNEWDSAMVVGYVEVGTGCGWVFCGNGGWRGPLVEPMERT